MKNFRFPGIVNFDASDLCNELKVAVDPYITNVVYIGNAFSLQMVEGDCNISVRTIKMQDMVLSWNNTMSCIGHEDTANIVSRILGVIVPINRTSITLSKGDILYVAQVVGGRLPEGTTELPEGFTIEWKEVKII